MTRSPVRWVVPVLLAAALAGFGCASPPEAEKKAAEEAMSAAKAAGAETYAPSDFAAAADALKAAETQMGAKKYNEAKTAYVKAKELAGKAAAAVEAGKAAVKSQVESALVDTGKRWQELEGKVKAVSKKLKAEQKQAWEADAKSVKEALETARVATGTDPLAAREKLGPVVAALDKWDAELKALAAPPQVAKKPGQAAKKPAKK